MHTEHCRTIHEVVARLPLLNGHDIDQAPANGIYFMYEKGQRYVSGVEGTSRIVAIGINPTQNQLRQRLHKHLQGTKKVSVFRLYVGTALLERDGDPESVRWEWFGNRSVMPEVEQRVTAYLAKHITVRCVVVDNRLLRERLQKRLIGTLANCSGCCPCDDWLGLYALDRNVKKLGLWINYYESSRQDLDEFGIQILRELVNQHVNGSAHGA